MQKICSACKISKPLQEFGKKSSNKSGLMAHCILCDRIKGTRRYYLNREARLAKAKIYLRTPKAKAVQSAYNKRKRETNRLHERAREMVRLEIQMGRMIRKPCEVCGDKQSQGHHPDYSKPLEVVWLCQTHHSERHRRYTREQLWGNQPFPAF